MKDSGEILSHKHRSLILSMYLSLAIGLGLLPYAWMESRLNEARAQTAKPAEEPVPAQSILMFPIQSASPSPSL